MRVLGATTLALLVALAGAAPASAANPIGSTFDPDDTTICGGQTFLQTGSPGDQYAAPTAGVITSWSFQGDPVVSQMKLKVGRATGGGGGAEYTIVGDSALETPAPSAVSSFQTRISVAAGDVIGFFAVTNAPCADVTGVSPQFVLRAIAGDQPAGSTATFSIPVSNQQLDVSAVLEPDCDSDGFGDETQDQDLSACPPAPQTTITKAPKHKTKKRKATFEFTASEPGATFECSLDGKPFEPCSSPDKFKVKRGKHSFDVRAKDAGNHVDNSPASAKWTVKKKKRK